MARGQWRSEDLLLINYVVTYGEGSWNSLTRSKYKKCISIFVSFGGDPPPLPTSDLEASVPLLPLLVEVVTTSNLEASAPLLPLFVETGAASDPRRTEGHCSVAPSFHSCFGLANDFLFSAWGCFCIGSAPRGGVPQQPRSALILLAVVQQLTPHPSSCAGAGGSMRSSEA
jgi:hypothetical protein